MCGCRQSSQSPAPPAAVSNARSGAVAPRASVPLAYRGTRALLVRGPATGAGYACYPGETVRVHERDAPHLLASGAFVRAG
jgi:hypothetical protein